MTTERELRREATTILERTISSEVWTVLKRSGHLELALTMETGAQDIADEVPDVEARIAAEADGGPTSPRPRRNGPEFWRLASQVLAELARQEQDPWEFRQQMGIDEALTLAGAVDWISEQHASSMPRWRDEDERHKHDNEWVGWPLTLSYIVPGQAFTPTIVCGSERIAEEPLDQLALRASQMEARFGWSQAHAVAFLLCEFTPWCAPIQTSWNVGSPVRPPFVTLRVDPRVAAEDVAAAYRSARGRLIENTSRRKPQPQQEMGLQLGLFALRTPEGEATTDTLRRWNRDRPEGKRPATRAGVSNFGRDMQKALVRAVGADWYR